MKGLLKVAFKARYLSTTSFETSKQSFQRYMEDLQTIFIIFGQGSLLSFTGLKELGVYPFNKLKSFINLLPFPAFLLLPVRSNSNLDSFCVIKDQLCSNLHVLVCLALEMCR